MGIDCSKTAQDHIFQTKPPTGTLETDFSTVPQSSTVSSESLSLDWTEQIGLIVESNCNARQKTPNAEIWVSNLISSNPDMKLVSKMNKIHHKTQQSLEKIGPCVREENLDSYFSHPSIRCLGPLKSKTTGHTYHGDLLGGVPHGYGIFIGLDCTYIEGYFRKGFPDCKVLMIFNTFDAYSGGLRDGKRHGFGEYLSMDGDIERGEWRDNKRHGYFIKCDCNGNKLFEGPLVEDRFHGRCFYVDRNKGLTYTGYFKNNLFYGPGKLKTLEGEFEGNFTFGKKNGYGVLRKSTGEVLKGEWSNDKLIDGTESLEAINHGFGQAANKLDTKSTPFS